MLASPWLFALALLFAARLRLLHVLTLRRTPFFSALIGDSAHYDAWGQALAKDGFLGSGSPFFVDPLYPYFLGVVYRVAGHDLWVVRLLQVGLSLGTCALVGLLARRGWGPVAGTLAAWGWALFRPDVFNTGEVDKTALGLCLTSGALLLSLRPGLRSRAAAGALFGLATLARGNLGLAALVPALFFALEVRPVRWSSPGVRSALAFAAAFLLAVLPATLRNRVVSGEWVLTTTGLGANFYLGHNPLAGSGSYDALPFVRPEAAFEEIDFHGEAERRVGHALSARATSDYWLGEGLAFVAAHPLLTAQRSALKLWLVFNDFETADMVDLESLARFAPVLALHLPGVGWFMPFAALGLVSGWRRREVRLLAVFLGVLAGSLAAFFVLARFRVFVMPVVVAAAGGGVVALAEATWTRRWGAVAGGVALVAAVGTLCAWPPPSARLAKVNGPLNLAAVLASRGAPQAAETLLREAHAAAPEAPGPSFGLAALAFERHRYGEAREHVQRCLQADPAWRGAWALQGRIDEAQGRLESAARAYELQLELTPEDTETRARLAALQGDGGVR